MLMFSGRLRHARNPSVFTPDSAEILPARAPWNLRRLCSFRGRAPPRWPRRRGGGGGRRVSVLLAGGWGGWHLVHGEVVVVVISAECEGVKGPLGLGERDQPGLALL